MLIQTTIAFYLLRQIVYFYFNNCEGLFTD
jgi:hypothetical protein